MSETCGYMLSSIFLQPLALSLLGFVILAARPFDDVLARTVELPSLGQFLKSHMVFSMNRSRPSAEDYVASISVEFVHSC